MASIAQNTNTLPSGWGGTLSRLFNSVLTDLGVLRTPTAALVTDLTATRAEVVKLVDDLAAVRAEVVKLVDDVAAGIANHNTLIAKLNLDNGVDGEDYAAATAATAVAPAAATAVAPGAITAVTPVDLSVAA